MSMERARAHLAAFGVAERIQEFDVSSATVDLAAQALGVEGARIAKTLSFKLERVHPGRSRGRRADRQSQVQRAVS